MVNKKINVEANEIDFDVKSKPPRAASACAYAIETLVKKCWIKDIKDIFYLGKKIIQPQKFNLKNSVFSCFFCQKSSRKGKKQTNIMHCNFCDLNVNIKD